MHAPKGFPFFPHSVSISERYDVHVSEEFSCCKFKTRLSFHYHAELWHYCKSTAITAGACWDISHKQLKYVRIFTRHTCYNSGQQRNTVHKVRFKKESLLKQQAVTLKVQHWINKAVHCPNSKSFKH